MENILPPMMGNGGGRGGPGPQGSDKAPFMVSFGEGRAAIPCSNCTSREKVGFWIIMHGKGSIVCIHCLGKAIQKYQDTHVGATAVQLDAEVPLEVENQAVQDAIKNFPDVPEKTVASIAHYAIRQI